MNRRLTPALVGSVVTAFFSLFVIGQAGWNLVLVVPCLMLALVALFARRRPALAEHSWTSPTPGAPVLAAGGSSRQVAAALGRVESRELALSGWFGAGVGFLVVIFMAFAVAYANDNGEVWLQMAGLSPWFAHPLAGMTVVAAHRAVTRPARDGTVELFDTCPTEPGVRTAGILRSAVVPSSVFIAFLVVYFATVAVRSPALHGPLPLDAVPVLLAGPVLAVGAVFLGVAVGSWVRFGLAPVVAVVAVGMLAITLATNGDPGWNGLSGLSTFGPQADFPLLFELAPTWWYLAWVVALAGIVAAVAMARFRRDRPVQLVAAAGLVLAVVAAVGATAPLDGDEAAHVADLIARPAAHQTCETPANSRVQVCTYDGYTELRRRIADEVGPVGRAMPSTAATITLRQGYDAPANELPDEVRERLGTGIPSIGDDEVHLGFGGDGYELRDYRLRVAFSSLGLALPSEEPERPMSIAGQARGVLALWLGTRGLDLDDAVELATVSGGEDAFERGLAWPTMCGPVVWSPQDLAAARLLMPVPEAEVTAVLAGDVARWTDPATTTDELLAALGLPAVGPQEDIVVRGEDFC